jgi:HAD superfamily hydrolase (TIGR01509 family)
VIARSEDIQAVLFDFSGTLFRLEEDSRWLDALTDSDGLPLDQETRTELMRSMTVPSGEEAIFDDEYRHAWENRDLDPISHRKVYLELIKRSGISRQEFAEALYARLPDPDQWTPYPDAETALQMVKSLNKKIAVISNIPFDIRPAFVSYGLDSYVDEFVLSFEVAEIKPHPAIFQFALDKLNVEARHALMIGDNEHDDGGATALGCAFERVEPLSTVERPAGLLKALKNHNIG